MTPVIWRYRQGLYIFVNEGVYRLGTQYREAQYKTLIWTLLDSDRTQGDITALIDDMPFFVIYATSPAKQCWSHLHKSFSVSVVVMNPWTRSEIHQA